MHAYTYARSDSDLSVTIEKDTLSRGNSHRRCILHSMHKNYLHNLRKPTRLAIISHNVLYAPSCPYHTDKRAWSTL